MNFVFKVPLISLDMTLVTWPVAIRLELWILVGLLVLKLFNPAYLRVDTKSSVMCLLFFSCMNLYIAQIWVYLEELRNLMVYRMFSGLPDPEFLDE